MTTILRILRGIPRAVRAMALVGLLLTALYAALYFVIRSVDASTAAGMLRMYALTIAAGREAAMLDALVRGMHPGLVYGLSVLDDFGSFLLALPFAWLVVRLLKRFSGVRWTLAHFEKQALLRRHWVHRWGLGGLALVYFLPGFGAGVPVTVLLGVLSRIRFRQLVPFFALATLVVDGLWTIALVNAVDVLPEAAWVQSLPLVVVGIVVLLAAAGAWRGRSERHVALLDWSVQASARELRRWEAQGIQPHGDVVRVDVDRVALAVRGRERRKGRLLEVAELVLLGMAPEEAMALVQAGVHGIDDVAGMDAAALARTVPGVTREAAAAWTARGVELLDLQHLAWRQ